MMDGKSLIAGTALAGVAIWAFLSFSGTHDAEQEARSLEHSRDVAEFKRDFAKAFDGKDNPELMERAKKANDKLDAAQARKEEVDTVEREKRNNVEASFEDSMRKDGINVNKIANELANPKK